MLRPRTLTFPYKQYPLTGSRLVLPLGCSLITRMTSVVTDELAAPCRGEIASSSTACLTARWIRNNLQDPRKSIPKRLEISGNTDCPEPFPSAIEDQHNTNVIISWTSITQKHSSQPAESSKQFAIGRLRPKLLLLHSLALTSLKLNNQEKHFRILMGNDLYSWDVCELFQNSYICRACSAWLF